MTGFRNLGGAGARPAGQLRASGATASSPFTQVQILHLMKTEFARARRHGHPVSCLVMQVDRLQALADLHGAALKDIVREHLARLVREKTRGHDHFGIVGEDRLLMVLPQTDAAQAAVVAERLRDAFSHLEVSVAGNAIRLTLSQGVASCADQETLFFDTLLAQAEVAMEWAAEGGGDRLQVFARDRFARPG